MKGFTQFPRHILDTSYGSNMKLFKAWAVLLICMRFMPCNENGIEIMPGQALMTKAELQDYFEADARGVRDTLRRFRDDGNIDVEYIGRSHVLITVLNPGLEGFSGNKKRGRPVKSDEKVMPEKNEEGLMLKNEVLKNDELENECLKNDAFENDAFEDDGLKNEKRKNEKDGYQKTENRFYEEDPESTYPFDEDYNNEKNTPEKRGCEKKAYYDNSRYNKKALRDDRTSDASDNTRNKKEADGLDSEETLILGDFRNVHMTKAELKLLQEKVPGYNNYITRLSAYLMNNPQKHYNNHCSIIVKWWCEDTSDNNGFGRGNKIQNSVYPQNSAYNSYNQGKNYPSVSRSYDIEEAEKRAKAGVPTLVKRDKATEMRRPV